MLGNAEDFQRRNHEAFRQPSVRNLRPGIPQQIAQPFALRRIAGKNEYAVTAGRTRLKFFLQISDVAEIRVGIAGVKRNAAAVCRLRNEVNREDFGAARGRLFVSL